MSGRSGLLEYKRLAKRLAPLLAVAAVITLSGCNTGTNTALSPRAQRLIGRWTLKRVEGKDPATLFIKDYHLKFFEDGWFGYIVHLQGPLTNTSYEGEGKWQLSKDVLVYHIGPTQEKMVDSIFSVTNDKLTLSPDPVLHPAGQPNVTCTYIRTPRFE
ncbi:MAG: hypothetical protein M3Y56_08170 [Armatimonadota bacterium]|nr:hypothetical protein [Armatimonadota bacterium]